MYTIDMANGFRKLDDPATYHQNHRAWIDADPTVCEAHERAGYTSQGLWKHFKKADSKLRHGTRNKTITGKARA